MCRCVVCVYLCSQCFIVSAFTFSDLMLLVGRQERQHYLHLTQGTDNTHTHTAHLRSYDTQPMCGVTTHTLRSHDTVFISHKALTTHTHSPSAESRHTRPICIVTTHTLRSHDTVFISHKAPTTQTHTAHDTYW